MNDYSRKEHKYAVMSTGLTTNGKELKIVKETGKVLNLKPFVIWAKDYEDTEKIPTVGSNYAIEIYRSK